MRIIPTPRAAMVAMPQAAMSILSNKAAWTSVSKTLSCPSAAVPQAQARPHLRAPLLLRTFVANSMSFNNRNWRVSDRIEIIVVFF